MMFKIRFSNFCVCVYAYAATEFLAGIGTGSVDIQIGKLYHKRKIS